MEPLEVAVRAAFIEFDPAALLDFGFPEDEYGPEVRDLCSRIAAGAPVDEATVTSVIEQWFHRDQRAVAAPMATMITRLLENEPDH